MSATPAALVARLRTDVHAHDADTKRQALYEQWIPRERWPLVPVALALLTGIDPAAWDVHVAACDGRASADALASLLARDLEVDGDGAVDALQLYAWARGQGIDFPQAGAMLFDFIARTLPAKIVPTMGAVPMPSAAVDAAERAAVLGAALALATRFTEQCLDAERMFDSARMVALLRAQSAVWFGERPPRMDDATMTALLERHIHG